MDQSPFALSFEEIKSQADANMKADKGEAVPAQVQPTESAVPETDGKSFLDMVENAERELAQEDGTNDQAAPAGQAASGMPNISFEDMFAQARAQEAVPSELSFDNLFAQAETSGVTAPVQEVTPAAPAMNPPKEQIPEQTPVLNFDDMFAQTKNETQDGGQADSEKQEPAKFAAKESVTEKQNTGEPVEEKPVAEVPAAEESAKEEPAPETPAVDEPVKDTSMAGDPVPETPAAEETSKEEEPKGRRAASRKAKKKSEEEKEKKEKEPLPDNTGAYRVDVLGEGMAEEKPEPQAAAGQLSVETLFTPEEIAAFRADIRTFVRKEFKQAMVGVMKELLNEFNE